MMSNQHHTQQKDRKITHTIVSKETQTQFSASQQNEFISILSSSLSSSSFTQLFVNTPLPKVELITNKPTIPSSTFNLLFSSLCRIAKKKLCLPKTVLLPRRVTFYLSRFLNELLMKIHLSKHSNIQKNEKKKKIKKTKPENCF